MRISKKFHLGFILAPLAALALGSSSGGKTDPDPLSGDNAKLVGDWSAPGTTVHIGADRSFSFESKNGGTSKSYAGSVKRIENNGAKIVVNALIEVNVDVQKAPADVGGVTKMTIEGVEVTKGAAGAAAPEVKPTEAKPTEAKPEAEGH